MIHSKVLDADTQNRLNNWARWARNTLPCYDVMWYPKASPGALNVKPNRLFNEPRNPNAPPSIKILDAENVEQAIYQLHHNAPELAHCLRCR